MENQLKLKFAILSLFICFSFSIAAQNSLPMGIDAMEYTTEQKVEINTLLDNTKSILVEKLNRSKDDEYISKIIITNSYKFAKGYSDIMNKNNVAFNLVTSSTSFMGCWVSDNFISTGTCWNKHLSKVNGAEFASLR